MEFNKDRIDKLHNEFIQAESEIKKTEIADNAFPQPPINELRYSYHHFLSALRTNNEDEFRSAEKHIRRAIYDAIDIRLVTYLEAIKSFKDDFSNIPISDTINNWDRMLVQIREAQQAISDNVNGDSRSQRIEVHSKHAKNLQDIYNICDANREELKKKIIAETKKTRNFIITIILSILAIVISIVLS